MSMNRVEIPSDNSLGPLPCFVTSGDHKSAVIVLQEWWGVNDQIKQLAEKWYGAKHVALIPDLYRGKVAIDHEIAGHYMNDLDWQGAVKDIQASVNYLKEKGITKVGVVGFCMGGALTIASSCLVDGLSAAVPFYGIPSMGDPSAAKTPLQLHFGTKDALVGFSDITAQDALEAKLKGGKRIYEFFKYEDAGHAFVNESNKQNFRADYAEIAHKRTLEFFEKYLN